MVWRILPQPEEKQKSSEVEFDGGEDVKAGMIGTGVVVQERIRGDEGPCLLEQSVFRVCLGSKCVNDKSHFEAEVWWVGNNTAEAIELTGKNVAFARIVDIGGKVDKSGESDITESWLDAFVVKAGDKAA